MFYFSHLITPQKFFLTWFMPFANASFTNTKNKLLGQQYKVIKHWWQFVQIRCRVRSVVLYHIRRLGWRTTSSSFFFFYGLTLLGMRHISCTPSTWSWCIAEGHITIMTNKHQWHKSWDGCVVETEAFKNYLKNYLSKRIFVFMKK